jgi:transposase InsO family protein
MRWRPALKESAATFRSLYVFVRSMGIEQVVSTARSPWQNAYVERVIGSLRRECTDHIIVTGAAQLRRVLRE